LAVNGLFMKTTMPELNPWVMALRPTLAVTITIGVVCVLPIS